MGRTWMVFLKNVEFHKQKCIVSINSTYNYRTKLQLFPFILCRFLCRKANVKNKTKHQFRNCFTWFKLESLAISFSASIKENEIK